MLKNYFLFFILMCCYNSSMAQDYVHLGVSSGFNSDVIANGIGPVSNSTTNSFDYYSYNLVSQNYRNQSTDTPLPLDAGLPVSGLLSAVNDPDITFQLGSYSQNNSLRLTDLGDSGNIAFSNQEQAIKLILLASTGDALLGKVTFSVRVHFTDNTFEDFTNLMTEDWYTSYTSIPIIVAGKGRVGSFNNLVFQSTVNPLLFGVELDLAVSNYYKKISKIEVTKTNSTTGVVNLFAVTAEKTPDCFAPNKINISNLDSSNATINWLSAAIAPGIGYEFEVRTSGAAGSGFPGLILSGTVSNKVFSKTITGLQPLSKYSIYVRSKCAVASFSKWSKVQKIETKCSISEPTVTDGFTCTPNTVNLNATNNTGILEWFDSPTSRTVLGSGPSFTTPHLTSTTSYWVDAKVSYPTIFKAGRPEIDVKGSPNDLNTFVNWGLVFDLSKDVLLKSTDVYAGESGKIAVKVVDSNGIEVASTGEIAISAGGMTTPITIPLGFYIPEGRGYRLVIKSFDTVKLFRDLNPIYPIVDSENIFTLTSGYFNGNTPNYYYFFYNIAYEKACISVRKEVKAQVAANSPTTIASTQTYCEDSKTKLIDLDVDGSNIKWYDEPTGGNPLNEMDMIIDGGLYYASQSINGCESIDRLAITTELESVAIPVSNTSVTYSYKDVATALTATALAGNSLLWYTSLTGIGQATAPIPNTMVVGTTKYWVKQKSSSGCESQLLEIIVTVNPKILTVTANANQSKFYGNTDPVLTYTANGFVTGEDNSLLTGSLSRSAGETLGTYTINKGSLSAGPNYTIQFVANDFKIVKAAITGLSFDDKTFTYDGTVKSLAVVGTLPPGVWVNYANNNQINANTYTVTANIDGGVNYENSVITAILTIKKAPLVINFSDKTFTYDGTAHSIPLLGTLPGGVWVTVYNNFKTDVGIYTVTADIDGGTNYESSTQTAVLTIEKAVITGITFTDKTVTYNGATQSLAINGTLPAGASVTYTNNDQTETGIYTVTADIDGGTNYESSTQTAVLTIEKATVSGITFTDKTVIYDGTTQSLAINGTLPAGASVTYTNNDQTETGIYTVTADIDGGTNYESSTQTAVLTIEKATVSGITFTDKTVIYDGTTQFLAINGTLPTGASVTYTNNDQTKAGVYTVTADIDGGTNYESSTQTAVLTIEKATVSGITFTDKTVIYDGKPKSLTIMGTLPTGASVTYTNNDQTETGVYTVTADIDGGTNYGSTTKTAVLTIEKAAISGITFTDKTVTYDGTPKSLVISGTLPTGVSVTYTNNDQTEAGVYTVTADIDGGTNYESSTQTAVLTIEKATISGITFTDKTVTYDGTPKSLVISGTLPTGVSVTYTNNDQTETGVYSITADLDGGSNHQSSTQTAVLTIEKATVSGITFTDKTFTYDGTTQSLAINGTLPTGVSVTYTNNDQTEAGVYTVTAHIDGGSNYQSSTQTAVLTIEKATVSGITFTDKTVTYDGTIQSLAINGTLPTGVSVTYTNNDQTEAGVYTVTADIDGGTNYESSTKTAVLTIEKATVSGITFTDKTVTYDGTTQSLAINGTLPTGVSVTYTNNNQTETGIYTVTAHINGGDNYMGSTKTALLTIEKATVSGITFTDKTVTYDGTTQSLAINGTLPTGVSVTYTNNDQTETGIYTVTAHINGRVNYEDTSKTAVLTIEKAVITGITFTDKTVTYDGSVKSLAIVGTLPPGVTVTYANNNQKETGIYTVTAQIDGGANYISTTKTAVLIIDKANLSSIVFDGDSFVYDGFAQSLAISGNLPTGVTVTYSNNGQIAAGTYTVVAQIDGGNNYNNLTLTATLIIAKATINHIGFTSATIPYTGLPKSLFISGSLPTGATVTYQNNGQINLGVYQITATINGGINYNDLVLTATLTIEKGVLSNIYLPSGIYTYDGTVKSLMISGNTLPAGTSVSYQNNDQINAGLYTVTALINGGLNYHDRVLTSALTIKQAPIENIGFPATTVTYDSTVKALSIIGTLPADATVTYQNNTNIDAGVYTVIADIDGGKNYAYRQLIAKLTIEKAPQLIHFETLPVLTLEDATDFQLSASVASGLAVDYTYTFVSTTAAAEVSNTGWVNLNHPGSIVITALQEGDKNYLAAKPVSQELHIESRDASIHEIWIGDRQFSNPTEEITYVMDCDDLDSKVKVKIQTQLGTTIDPGQEFVIEVIKPGAHRKTLNITAENGKMTKEYQITIVKPFPFNFIVEQKYNNVLLINNNPKTNGGFRFVKYEWYKNGQLIGEEQVYTAGNRAIDLLDPKAIYHVILTTDTGDVIPVCPSNIEIKHMMGVKLYPNPVELGQKITLTISDMQPEWEGESLKIYDINGRLLQQTVIQGIHTEIQLSTAIQSGIYLAVFKVRGEHKVIKFVVK